MRVRLCVVSVRLKHDVFRRILFFRDIGDFCYGCSFVFRFPCIAVCFVGNRLMDIK